MLCFYIELYGVSVYAYRGVNNRGVANAGVSNVALIAEVQLTGHAINTQK